MPSHSENTIRVYEGAHVGWDCEIGEGSVIGQDTWVGRGSRLGRAVRLNRRNLVDDSIIGDYTYTGQGTVIKHARIGKFCSISWNCSIAGGMHDPSCLTTHPFPRLLSFGIAVEDLGIEVASVSLGCDVWIGAGACILPGVRIGHGAVVGAGAVVTTDVSPYAIVAGVPARIIRYRFDEETVAKLLEASWWDWPIEQLQENLGLFSNERFDASEVLRIARDLSRHA